MGISPWVKELRDIIGTDLVVMIGAAALVTDNTGRILLQKRADNGKWGVPGGGMEPGEEPAQTAIREVYEETGLEVEIKRLIGVFGGKDHVRAYPDGDQFAYISITFECRVIGGEINPDPEETLEARWFAIDELPSGFTQAHYRRINAMKSGKLPFFELAQNIQFQPAGNYMQMIREKIGNRLLMSPGATGLIFDERGHVLVQKRGDDGLWNLPGGLYEPGEEPAEIVMREVYEETGLTVKPLRLIGIYSGKEYCHTYPNGDRVAYVNIVFLCEIVSGELVSGNEETLQLCFVPPQNLPDPFTDKHRILVDHALNRTDPYFVT